ncbi:hypothetical protein IF2G_05772 [Cordyceps javanica]|nr:hypothetical protein IF2G_05772 [Cordyceps javanica]
MGRSSSTASSPTVCGTRLGAYPGVRVVSDHYASSDTTLAESLPPSPRNQPPPYGDDAVAWPPQYHDDLIEREKRHGEPLPRNTLIIRLCTSIFIAFIVCLIVAAVVGRIHDTQLRKSQDAQRSAAHSINGTRYTMMAEAASSRSTMVVPTTTATANFTTSAHTSIERPTGTVISTYSCPYIAAPTTSVSHGSNGTASRGPMCGLTMPFRRFSNHTKNETILDVSLHPLKDCVIARTSFKLPNSTLGYRCALSCSEDGGPGIEGLQDGWKWRCS